MSDFHLIASRSPGAPGTTSAVAITATVPDPPRNFAALDNGTILRGTVQGRDKDGLISVKTDQGVLKIATNINLPTGSNVTLEVRSVGDRLQILILAVEQGAAAQSGNPESPQGATPAQNLRQAGAGAIQEGATTASQQLTQVTDDAEQSARVIVAGARLTAIVVQSVPRDLLQNTAPPLLSTVGNPVLQQSPDDTTKSAAPLTGRAAFTADFRQTPLPPISASLMPEIHARIAALFAEPPAGAGAQSDPLSSQTLPPARDLSLPIETRDKIIALFVGNPAAAPPPEPPTTLPSNNASNGPVPENPGADQRAASSTATNGAGSAPTPVSPQPGQSLPPPQPNAVTAQPARPTPTQPQSQPSPVPNPASTVIAPAPQPPTVPPGGVGGVAGQTPSEPIGALPSAPGTSPNATSAINPSATTPTAAPTASTAPQAQPIASAANQPQPSVATSAPPSQTGNAQSQLQATPPQAPQSVTTPEAIPPASATNQPQPGPSPSVPSAQPGGTQSQIQTPPPQAPQSTTVPEAPPLARAAIQPQASPSLLASSGQRVGTQPSPQVPQTQVPQPGAAPIPAPLQQTPAILQPSPQQPSAPPQPGQQPAATQLSPTPQPPAPAALGQVQTPTQLPAQLSPQPPASQSVQPTTPPFAAPANNAPNTPIPQQPITAPVAATIPQSSPPPLPTAQNTPQQPVPGNQLPPLANQLPTAAPVAGTLPGSTPVDGSVVTTTTSPPTASPSNLPAQSGTSTSLPITVNPQIPVFPLPITDATLPQVQLPTGSATPPNNAQPQPAVPAQQPATPLPSSAGVVLTPQPNLTAALLAAGAFGGIPVPTTLPISGAPSTIPGSSQPIVNQPATSSPAVSPLPLPALGGPVIQDADVPPSPIAPFTGNQPLPGLAGTGDATIAGQAGVKTATIPGTAGAPTAPPATTPGGPADPQAGLSLTAVVSSTTGKSPIGTATITAGNAEYLANSLASSSTGSETIGEAGLGKIDPAAKAQVSGPLPTGTELRLRVLNILQPGVTPSLTTAQITAAAGGKTMITGQILGHTPAGHPVIHTSLGDLVLQQQATLPTGAQITLALEAVEMAGAAATMTSSLTPQLAALNLAQGWPTLLDLLLTLQQGPAGGGQLSAAAGGDDPAALAHLAQPGSKLAAGMAAAVDAFRSGDFEKLFGPLTSALKSAGGKQETIKKLRDEFTQLSSLAQDRNNQDWRTFFLPLWDDGKLQQINLFYRRPKRGQAGDKDKDATRFIVDVNFTRLGGCQLDGLIRKKNFDLMIRSHRELPLAVKRDIAGLFAEARELGNYAGELRFQTAVRFPTSPLDEVTKDVPSVTA